MIGGYSHIEWRIYDMQYTAFSATKYEECWWHGFQSLILLIQSQALAQMITISWSNSDYEYVEGNSLHNLRIAI